MSDDRLKILFGYFLAGILAVSMLLFGLKEVRQDTSYGVKDIIDALKPVLAFWAGWAFSNRFGNKRD